jgi:hypothetical protein
MLRGEKDILSRVLPSFVVGVLPKPFEVSHLARLVENYLRTAQILEIVCVFQQ